MSGAPSANAELAAGANASARRAGASAKAGLAAGPNATAGLAADSHMSHGDNDASIGPKLILPWGVLTHCLPGTPLDWKC